MGNLTEYFNPDYEQEEFERKHRFLSEIKTKRDHYEKLLVEFLHDFVLDGKPLSESYLVAYEELLEDTQKGRLPSSMFIFEHMVFSVDELPYDPGYENLH
ncbi:hypothetical protein AOC19_06195 [Polynucleobacter asymbioticus]|uniref:hypothetical protein n=1 Tax=Polynucleobacter asymbioticus TaxID=576611 RepID=UPI001BFEA22E|nr:hypothetical protein [Polynucleobacter asymbioticus]QWD84755.1 hypothetical protein AOC19_06195 [Polynucleobacter asymbioticus]